MLIFCSKNFEFGNKKVIVTTHTLKRELALKNIKDFLTLTPPDDSLCHFQEVPKPSPEKRGKQAKVVSFLVT